MSAMLRLFKRRSGRPPIRMGRVDNRTIRTTVTRNAGFVSFISESGSASGLHPDRHDRRLRRQKFVRWLVTGACASAFSWIALESARALSIF